MNRNSAKSRESPTNQSKNQQKSHEESQENENLHIIALQGHLND